MAKITTLIQGKDTFEMVRDKIAAILVTESANQVALATSSGEPDPQQWALKVYTERAAPWDNYTTGDIIVNVWFDTANVDTSASNTVQEQTMRGTFNIDVIGFARSKSNGAGHTPGDMQAAFNAARGVRFVRNILMAGQYTYLDMRPIVGQRMPTSISSFQPQLNTNDHVNAVGARMSLDVRYSEFSPQYEPVDIEQLSVELQRAEDGLVYAVVEYDYTNP